MFVCQLHCTKEIIMVFTFTQLYGLYPRIHFECLFSRNRALEFFSSARLSRNIPESEF